MALDSTYALITLANLREYLQVETADGYDDQLERTINAVSRWFSNQCNRKFPAQDLTEYYDGDNGKVLFLRNYPINSTASTIEIYIDTDTPRSYAAGDKVSSDSILVYSDEGKIVLDDDYFDKGPQSVKVVYNAGYTTIPHDLQEACMEMCAVLWKKESGKLQHTGSVSIAGASVTLELDKAAPAWVMDVIDRYWRPPT